MSDFFDRQNELFNRAVSGDAAAREQLILDNMDIAKQVAFSLMRGKPIRDDDKVDELQAAYELLVLGIDNMLSRGEMYNVKYLRNFLKLRLISYHRKMMYGIDDGKLHRRNKDAMFNVCNPVQLVSHHEFNESNTIIFDGRDVDIDIGCNLGEDFSTYYNMSEDVENRIVVEGLLAHLNADEREVIELIFYKGLTQCEIGERLGISQGMVSIKYNNAMKKMKESGCEYYDE